LLNVRKFIGFSLSFIYLGKYLQSDFAYAVLEARKGQVVPVLLTKHHAMKAYWGSGFIAPLVL
jgi:hypothetical protein